MTLVVVNDAPQEFDLTVELGGLNKSARLYRYRITSQDSDRDDLKLAPQAEFPLSSAAASFRERLAPRSITTYSTYKLAHADHGIVSE